MGGENLYAYVPNPTGWMDPLGWHQALAFLDGVPVLNPDARSGGLWNSDWGSRNSPFNGFGAEGHSETKILQHLEQTLGKEGLAGKTLEIHSLGQMSNNGRVLMSELAACPTCQRGISSFAQRNGVNVKYTWTDRAGVKQSTHWDTSGKATGC